jgi:hypothetical protein
MIALGAFYGAGEGFEKSTSVFRAKSALSPRRRPDLFTRLRRRASRFAPYELGFTRMKAKPPRFILASAGSITAFAEIRRRHRD